MPSTSRMPSPFAGWGSDEKSKPQTSFAAPEESQKVGSSCKLGGADAAGLGSLVPDASMVRPSYASKDVSSFKRSGTRSPVNGSSSSSTSMVEPEKERPLLKAQPVRRRSTSMTDADGFDASRRGSDAARRGSVGLRRPSLAHPPVLNEFVVAVGEDQGFEVSVMQNEYRDAHWIPASYADLMKVNDYRERLLDDARKYSPISSVFHLNKLPETVIARVVTYPITWILVATYVALALLARTDTIDFGLVPSAEAYSGVDSIVRRPTRSFPEAGHRSTLGSLEEP